jgi:mono/diheme cytochrome c family protein
MNTAKAPTPARGFARRLARWLGYLLGGLAGLALLGAIGVFIASEMRINRVYATQPAPLTTSPGPTLVERGRHLVVNVMACVDCHGANMAGGTVIDDPALGRAIAANLTTGKGGVGSQLTDADIVRALRHGLKPNGQSLLVMPVDDYVALSEPDMAAIIAYLRSLAPVDNELPSNQVGPLGRLLMVAGQANLLSAESVPQEGSFPPTVPAGPTAEYGRYLARTSGCMGCHGPTLSGGRIPGGPPDFPTMPNITPAGAPAGWTDEQVMALIRSGRRPDGSQISDFMPYEYYAGMTGEELQALVAYLRSVPPKPFGNR